MTVKIVVQMKNWETRFSLLLKCVQEKENMRILYYLIPVLLYILLSSDFIVQWFVRFFLASLGTSSGILVSILPVLYAIGKFADKDDQKETEEKNEQK